MNVQVFNREIEQSMSELLAKVVRHIDIRDIERYVCFKYSGEPDTGETMMRIQSEIQQMCDLFKAEGYIIQ